MVCLCVSELFKQTHLNRIFVNMRVCVCVLLRICGGQETQPVGKDHSERTGGGQMVMAGTGLASEHTRAQLLSSCHLHF